MGKIDYAAISLAECIIKSKLMTVINMVKQFFCFGRHFKEMNADDSTDVKTSK